ncbi:hypothetical protein MKW94_023103, partial [Papaver nudicaule]|nr:hypothetical protein [Papaver nudicaule]
MANKKEKSMTRKPLIDISNGSDVKIKSNKKITSSQKEIKIEEEGDDKILDRLLLTHSEVSNLIHQIDELVVQPFKVKLKSRKERKEVESFTHVLSDIHSSLKVESTNLSCYILLTPFRVRREVSSPSEASESSSSFTSDNQIGESSPNETTPTAFKESSDVSEKAEQLDLDSLVSPSPLVSWHAELTVKNGRQLFMLTPLPRSKALSSVHCRSSTSTSVLERFTNLDAPPNTTLGLPSLRTISPDTSDDLLEGVNIKQPPNKVLSCFNEESATGTFLVTTPRQKLSPPKSCVLLEPISESFHHNFNNRRRLTPFPVKREVSSPSETSESSRSFTSESLALKYPELFGIRQTNTKSGAWRKEVNASLKNRLISPPKSCVLMEPPIEKVAVKGTKVGLSNFGFVLDERLSCAAPVAKKRGSPRGIRKPLNAAGTSILESTPLWKEPDSVICTGKGESTLKRELWTRFEAASSSVLHFDLSVLPEAPTKGFVDKFEE